MSQDNFVDPNTDDLNAFDDLLHGRAKELEEVAEPASEEKEVEVETDAETPNPETSVEEVETDISEDLPKGEPEETPPGVPKKTRFQERINELTRRAGDAERATAAIKAEKDAMQVKLDEILARLDPKPDTSQAVEKAPTGPTPTDLNDDGTEKYPLGEFDPNFIRDLTRYTMAEERKIYEEEASQRQKATEQETAQAALERDWQGKLDKAVENKYPDFMEKNQNLLSVLQQVDEATAEYLGNTIMNMEYGTDVLYHLASNPDEARRIVNMGPAKATIALGRLEALYAFEDVEKAEAPQKLKVSSAPLPPKHVNRGSSVATVVPDDTDDLDAFSNKMFGKAK